MNTTATTAGISTAGATQPPVSSDTSGGPAASNSVAPPSVVADVDYPNVPETTEPQQGEQEERDLGTYAGPLRGGIWQSQSGWRGAIWIAFANEMFTAATGPGTGGIVDNSNKPSFKEQVSRYSPISSYGRYATHLVVDMLSHG